MLNLTGGPLSPLSPDATMSSMGAQRRKTPFSLKMAIALLSLLAILATLQYRWLGQVSRAERQRMQTSLQSAVSRFADDFDREITSAFLNFLLDPRMAASGGKAEYAERFRLWMEEAPHPELIRNVYLVDRDTSGALQLDKLHAATGQFQPSAWPSSLDDLHRRLAKRPRPQQRYRPGFAFMSPLVSSDEALVLIIPQTFPWMGDTRQPRRPPPGPPPDANVILELDPTFITGELLPELADRYFGINYDVTVVDRSEPPRIVFSSAPTGPDGPRVSGDETADLYFLKPLQLRRDLWFRDRTRPRALGPRDDQPFNRNFLGRLLSTAQGKPGHWQLIVRHRAGSLEAAVSRVRFRNAAISSGILILLAVSVVMLVVSTQRAQELARQKMEFVAGISHELRTPLSVIRSAGQNLADATIKDPEQVTRYGKLIEDEGRRLSDLVEQVMEFAGAQADRKAYQLETVAIGGIVESALDERQSNIEKNGIEIDRAIAADLPMVRADASALRRAIQNLLDNATKYGAGSGRIVVRVKRELRSTTPMVAISIEDRGPGIAKADLPHLFEPFYRGEGAGRVHGSGLGLSLVQQIATAHGGRVSVTNVPHGGSRFIIHLPAVAEGES